MATDTDSHTLGFQENVRIPLHGKQGHLYDSVNQASYLRKVTYQHSLGKKHLHVP